MTASAASSALRTRRLQRTSASIAALVFLASCSWPRSRPSVPVGMPGESSSTGCDSAYAVAAAVIALVRPGPLVVTTTPGRPLTRAYASAA